MSVVEVINKHDALGVQSWMVNQGFSQTYEVIQIIRPNRNS